jgi:hypothetical protein
MSCNGKHLFFFQQIDHILHNLPTYHTILKKNQISMQFSLSDHCSIFVNILSRFSEKQLPSFLNDSVRKIKWKVARETVFKSNLPNFNYDALCEEMIRERWFKITNIKADYIL